MTGKTILVAEDNEDDRLLLAEAFAQACSQCQYRMVGDGQKTLDYIFGRGEYEDRQRYPQPALLLLDLKMPVMDGFEVLEALRRQPPARYFPVLVFSASSQHQDIDRARRLGCAGYLVKPATLSELIEMIKAVSQFWLRFNRVD